MQNRWTRLTGKLIAGLAIVTAMVGCSSNSPLAPTDNGSPVNKGGANTSTSAAQIEFGSHVASVDVVLRKLTFTTNNEIVFAASDAEIVRKNGGNDTPISFGDIVVGDSVEVRGNRQPDNSVLANRIRVKAEDNGAELEFGGRVSTINATARTLTLGGSPATINVLANADITNHDLQVQIDLSEIVVGDSVEIRGTSQPNGSVLADRVRLRKTDGMEDADLEFKATITGIDYSNRTFTVSGRTETIQIDSNTVVYAHLSRSESNLSKRGHGSDDGGRLGANDTLLDFTSLEVGDSVEVHANIVNATTLLAVAIELEDRDGIPDDVEFKATIAAIDPVSRLITFSGQTWEGTVSQTAILAGLNNEPLTLGDFAAGQLVEVKGFPGSGTALLVVSMHKENNL